MSRSIPQYDISFLYRPGERESELVLEEMNREFVEVGETCFDQVPAYQVFVKGRDAMCDKVVTIARDKAGKMVGFCSAVLLPVEGVGEVIHLGLTCVHPSARGHRLTHQLTSQLILNYVLRHRPFGRIWFSSLACVLSSLGNVALNFEDVFPSPFGRVTPSTAHLAIAEAIDEGYREHMAVNEGATFCPHTFVFRGSVQDTTFQKHEGDTRYHHRSNSLNQFYKALINFEAGDEVLQIGHFSAVSLIRYFLLPGKRKPVTAATQLLSSANP